MRGSRDEYTKARSAICESLVGLYLRLNGYLLIPNYLLHRARGKGFGLEAEVDYLGVRFPHQQEVLQEEQVQERVQENDEDLVLPEDKPLVDFVIVEVKEPSVEFNRPIRGEGGQGHIADVIQMLGFWRQEAAVGAVAGHLYDEVRKDKWPEFPCFEDANEKVSVRMIVFSREGSKNSERRRFISLEHVFDFVRKRMERGVPCEPYREEGYSPWRGLTKRLVTALDRAQRGGHPHRDLDEFIAHVMALVFEECG